MVVLCVVDGGVALLIVLLTVDLAPGVFYELLTLCVVLGLGGALLLLPVSKEIFMTIGIVEYNLRRRCFSRDGTLSPRSIAAPYIIPTCRLSGRQGKLSLVLDLFPKENLT